MNSIKTWIAVFSMALVFSIVLVMLWNKNAKYRIEEMKKVSDFIVESNFKQQIKREEADFIRSASIVEDKINNKKGYDATYDLTNLKTKALSLAPYGSDTSLEDKLNLIKCLNKTKDNSTDCSVEYAKSQTKRSI